jgi:hypothetical protein
VSPASEEDAAMHFPPAIYNSTKAAEVAPDRLAPAMLLGVAMVIALGVLIGIAQIVAGA